MSEEIQPKVNEANGSHSDIHLVGRITQAGQITGTWQSASDGRMQVLVIFIMFGIPRLHLSEFVLLDM